jgi:hypothetical protein
MMREHADHFASTLQRLHGMTEWGVKGFLADEAEAPRARPATGAEYLAERRAQRDRAETAVMAAQLAAAEIHRALGEHAADSTLAARQDRRLTGRDSEMVLNGAYLVARRAAPEFLRLVDEQRRGPGRDRLELELTGPWPPYHFVQAAG